MGQKAERRTVCPTIDKGITLIAPIKQFIHSVPVSEGHSMVKFQVLQTRLLSFMVPGNTGKQLKKRELGTGGWLRGKIPHHVSVRT